MNTLVLVLVICFIVILIYDYFLGSTYGGTAAKILLAVAALLLMLSEGSEAVNQRCEALRAYITQLAVPAVTALSALTSTSVTSLSNHLGPRGWPFRAMNHLADGVIVEFFWPIRR